MNPHLFDTLVIGFACFLAGGLLGSLLCAMLTRPGEPVLTAAERLRRRRRELGQVEEGEYAGCSIGFARMMEASKRAEATFAALDGPAPPKIDPADVFGLHV